jgi:hypothetical protein
MTGRGVSDGIGTSSPKSVLSRITAEVRSWPAYMRVRSSQWREIDWEVVDALVADGWSERQAIRFATPRYWGNSERPHG